MTYALLKADIAAWLDRTDLTAQIPSFVRLVEARIARDVRVGLLSVTSTVTILAGTSSIALPTGCVDVRGVAGHWRFMTPAALQQAVVDGNDSHTYTITGGTIAIGTVAAADVPIVLTYYTAPAAFVDDADTNALYAANPGLYLFGALAEASVFLADDSRAPLWEAKYRKSLEELRMADASNYFSQAEMPGLGVV